jgi:hypothetical protein
MTGSELIRLTVVFEKVPLGMGLGVKLKKGSAGGFGAVETVIGMRANCSLYVNRSKSGDNFEDSTLFTDLKDVPTEYDCIKE